MSTQTKAERTPLEQELLEALKEAEMELTAWDAEIASLGITPLDYEPRTHKTLRSVRAAIAKAEALNA